MISFGFVTLVIVLHNKNEAQVSNSKKHYIYYDRVNSLEEDELRRSRIWRYLLCLCCRKPTSDTDQQLNKINPGGDIDISYNDLQKLLDEFKEQMDILKSKLKEEQPPTNNDAAVEEPAKDAQEGEDDDEAELLREMHDLREFVNNNKECIEDFFHIIRKKDNQ